MPETASDGTLILRKFIGGTVGGVLQAASSHPFDTVKSRIQIGLFPNAWTCVRATFTNEGIRGFYRGVTPPLFLSGFCNSVLFGINQYMNNLVTPADHDSTKPLPLWRTAIAAQMTAPMYCLVITPMEAVKVKLQVQSGELGKERYSGPVDCVRKTFQSQGLAGIFQGYLPTVGSRIVGLPFYFGAYHATKAFLTPNGDIDMGLHVPLLSGIAAGSSFWASNYPLDFTKTQTQATGKRIREVVRSVYQREGILGFYRGFTTCLVRAIPANATVWIGIEYTTKYMKMYGY